ncbi:DHA2 family efflux MFS transporter permease subunit [Dactylosporangium sp. NPDC051485]|uniref:DHA2 family efflux MFS transporter permease subunit n=1 Tax=Dactylosporangium sp. NPDC051485 TaxID=3154846 RepID=UPI00341E1E5D
MPSIALDDLKRDDRLDPAVVKIGLILTVGALAVVLDTTIVSVALRLLATDLAVSVATIQWVTTGYLLALGMAIPLSTWALERLGGRRLWTFALIVFLAGSIGSSLAWNVASLITWRVVQGIGGGLLMPAMGTLIMQAAAGKALGRTASVAMLPLTVGPILGPLVGGAILTHFSWRVMFWINVPFCVAGLVLAWLYLPKERVAQARPKLDAAGFLLLASGIAGLLLGLTNAGNRGSLAGADVLLPALAGAALVGAFCVHALRHERPLVDVSLLTRRPLASATAVLFFNSVAIYGPLLLIPIYYLQGRGTSALSAGIILMPEAAGTLLGRSAAGWLTDKLGVRTTAIGATALVATATVPFLFLTAHTSGWLLALWLVLRGLGLGAVGVPATAGAYHELDRAQIGHSTVLTRTAVQVGGALGTAIFAVILARATTTHSDSIIAAINTAFGWSLGFGIAATALAFWLPGRSNPSTPVGAR